MVTGGRRTDNSLPWLGLREENADTQTRGEEKVRPWGRSPRKRLKQRDRKLPAAQRDFKRRINNRGNRCFRRMEGDDIVSPYEKTCSSLLRGEERKEIKKTKTFSEGK